MMKVVAGVMKRDFFHGGEVKLNERSVRYRVPRAAVLDGIVYVTEDRKFDGFFETMTVADNLYLGKLSGGANPMSVVSMNEARVLADYWTERLQLRAINQKARVIRTFRRQSAEDRHRPIANPEAEAHHFR